MTQLGHLIAGPPGSFSVVRVYIFLPGKLMKPVVRPDPRDSTTWLLSLRQPGNPQAVGVFGEVFRPTKDSDPILEVGNTHLRIEFERARHGLARLLKPSCKCIADSGDAQRRENIWPFPKGSFGPSRSLVVAAGKKVRE
jgi:hypothetical protein